VARSGFNYLLRSSHVDSVKRLSAKRTGNDDTDQMDYGLTALDASPQRTGIEQLTYDDHEPFPAHFAMLGVEHAWAADQANRRDPAGKQFANHGLAHEAGGPGYQDAGGNAFFLHKWAPS
jgi:hypothetical protein